MGQVGLVTLARVEIVETVDIKDEVAPKGALRQLRGQIEVELLDARQLSLHGCVLPSFK